MAKHINSFKLYINKNRNLFDLEKIDQTHSVPLDVQNLQNDDEFIKEWSSFTTDLFENPVTTLSTLEYCLHEVKLKIRLLVLIFNYHNMDDKYIVLKYLISLMCKRFTTIINILYTNQQ